MLRVLRILFLVFSANAILKKELFDSTKKPLEEEVEIRDFYDYGDDTLWVASLDYDDLDIDKLKKGTPDEEEEFLAIVGPRMNRFKQLQQKTQRVPSTEKPIKIKSPKIKTRKFKPELIKKGKKYNDPKYLKQLMAENSVMESEKKIDENEEFTKPKFCDDVKVLKDELIRSVNKFALTGRYEYDPDEMVFANNEHNPPIAVYFKGPFTSVVLNFQQKIFTYVINPPSPFPRWFSNEHIEVIHENQQTYVSIPNDVKKQFYSALLKILNMFFKLAT